MLGVFHLFPVPEIIVPKIPAAHFQPLVTQMSQLLTERAPDEYV